MSRASDYDIEKRRAGEMEKRLKARRLRRIEGMLCISQDKSLNARHASSRFASRFDKFNRGLLEE